MKKGSLLLLRVSLGGLLLVWGIDKIADPAHGQRVAEAVYWGLFGWPDIMPLLGWGEMLLGVMVVLGLERSIAYPALLLITGVTLLGVWRSVLDPWGWYLEGTNVLFYPSLVVFAGVLVLIAHRDGDRWTADELGEAQRRGPPAPTD